MKVETGLLQSTVGAGRGTSPRISEDQGFEALLRNTCRAGAGVRPDGNRLNAGEIQEAGRSLEVKPKEKSAVLRAEKVLDMLDLYRRKLADVHIPLQDIRPLVDEMHQAAEMLDGALGRLQPGIGAGEVTREVSTLAHSEIRRYREGGLSQSTS